MSSTDGAQVGKRLSGAAGACGLDQHVHFQVHHAPATHFCQGGPAQGVWNDVGRETIDVWAGVHGERDPVHGHRALGHEPAGQVRAAIDGQEQAAAALFVADHPADTVDVAQHQVSIEGFADADGITESSRTRADALKQADIVITGVPNKAFPLIETHEIRTDAVCINFSTYKNFTDEAADKADIVVLDARSVESGPVARVHVPRRIPFGFHANWFAAD